MSYLPAKPTGDHLRARTAGGRCARLGPAPRRDVALTTHIPDGYTHRMGIPEGHERVTIDVPSEVLSRLDQMSERDQVSRHARMRLILSLGSVNEGLMQEVSRAAVQEKRSAPPRVDPRRG